MQIPIKSNTFSQKIFLASFLLCTATIIVFASICFLMIRNRVQDIFFEKYSNDAQIVANTLEQLDKKTDVVLSNALYAAMEIIESKKEDLPTNGFLENLQQKLNVSSIDFFIPSGEFLRTSDYRMKNSETKLNLFQFCDGYRDLFTDKKSSDQTPLIPSTLTGKVTKYSLLSNSDNSFVLNLGYEADFVGNTLLKILDTDKKVSRVSLYTPNRKILGNYINKETESNLDFLNFGRNKSIVFKEKIKASVKECCECKVKNLMSHLDKDFHYLLEIEVSTKKMVSEINLFAILLSILSTFSILIAYYLSKTISNYLTLRIRAVNEKTEAIMQSKDHHKRLSISGTDEIAQMSQKFDTLLEKIEKAEHASIKSVRNTTIVKTTQMIAHDIRKPFSMLRTGMMLLERAKNEAEFRKTSLMLTAKLETSIANVDSMLSDIMHFSGNLKIKKEETSIIPTVRNALQEISFTTNNNLSISCSFKHSHQVIIDPNQMRRVLSNIVGNAVQAIGNKKERIWIDSAEDENRLKLTIRNSGSTIRNNQLDMLFEAFYSEGKNGGTGLGLAIAQKIVQAHHGKISASCNFEKSEVCFSIELPRSNALDQKKWDALPKTLLSYRESNPQKLKIPRKISTDRETKTCIKPVQL